MLQVKERRSRVRYIHPGFCKNKDLYKYFAGNSRYGTLYPKIRYNGVRYNEIIRQRDYTATRLYGNEIIR